MRLSSRQRAERIVALLNEQQEVEVAALTRLLNVSPATVRRDLHAMAEDGLLELTHGGATLTRRSDFSFYAKAMRQVEGKRIVGQLAAQQVHDGQSIFLDSGTTCFAMIPHLKRKRRLTVIVNSARLALELDMPDANIISLGGQYRPGRMDTVGPLATSTLERLRGYHAFIGADGVSMDFGPTASDIESAHLFGLAVQNAHRAWLLIDQSKFGAPSLYKIADWDRLSTVVTDAAPSAEWRQFLASRRIDLLTPQSSVAQEAQDAAR